MKSTSRRRPFYRLSFETQVALARPVAKRLLRGAFDVLDDEPIVSYVAQLIRDRELLEALPGADSKVWHRHMSRVMGGFALGIACASLMRPEIFDTMRAIRAEKVAALK